MAGLAWPCARCRPPGLCAPDRCGGGFYLLIVALFDVAGLRRLCRQGRPIWLSLMKKNGGALTLRQKKRRALRPPWQSKSFAAISGGGQFGAGLLLDDFALQLEGVDRKLGIGALSKKASRPPRCSTERRAAARCADAPNAATNPRSARR